MIGSSVPAIGPIAAAHRCGAAYLELAWVMMGMPKSRLPFVQAKDGLPARQVGPWVERKAHYVDYYADMFATGMKKWPRRAYVELFAGTGVSWDYGHRLEIDGSAVRALRRDFTQYVFVDIDEVATGALAERVARVARRPGQHPPTILTADCNDAIPAIRAAIAGAISLAFRRVADELNALGVPTHYAHARGPGLHGGREARLGHPRAARDRPALDGLPARDDEDVSSWP